LLLPHDADRDPAVAGIRQAFATNHLNQMQNEIEELIRRNPNDPEGYLWRGFLDLQRQDDYNAVRALRRAEALDANVYVLKLLAVAYYSVRQFRLFVMTMNEAMQKQPGDFAPYYYLGRYYVSVDAQEFAEAADYFKMAIRRNPRYFRSYYYFGYCNEIMRHLNTAEQQYRESMKLARAAGATSPLPYEGMARLRLLENKPSDALVYARQSVQLAPQQAASHKILAKAYTSAGRQKEASLEWKRTAALDLTDPSPYYHLFQIYSALGNTIKANAALAQFKKLSAIYGAD